MPLDSAIARAICAVSVSGQCLVTAPAVASDAVACYVATRHARAPILQGLDPNPVDIGTALTVTGHTDQGITAGSQAADTAAAVRGQTFSSTDGGLARDAVLVGKGSTRDISAYALASLTVSAFVQGAREQVMALEPESASASDGVAFGVAYPGGVAVNATASVTAGAEYGKIAGAADDAVATDTLDFAKAFQAGTPSQAPHITSLVPNPVTIGTSFVVNGGIVEAIDWAVSSDEMGIAIASVVPGMTDGATASDGFSLERGIGVGMEDGAKASGEVLSTHPVTLPATLYPYDTSGRSESTTEGDNLRVRGYVEYQIDAGAGGGLFYIDTIMYSLSGATVRMRLDGVTGGATYAVPSQEEEGDIMPAASVTEGTFTAANGATATQADDAAAGRGAPATRYKVRIINTHATDRLYVGTTQAVAETTSAAVVEADFGVWEDFLDNNVAVWVRPSSTNGITVRIIQYAL